MKRKTDEVEVSLDFVEEKVRIDTDDDVLDHLLETLFFYMETPVSIQASGDLRHHLWEDTGILIGRALRGELNEARIARYGEALIPMDEALVLCAVDISRPHLNFNLNPPKTEKGFSPVMAKQFLAGLARTLEATIHLKQLNGVNSHHVIEAGFKALGASLSEALQCSERLESTKGDLR